ncbi:MAG: nitronate monooxygenase family protein [Firmicutes bacterium]|nr:nitronate monooxygenase family protein [Bacillota bacterium]
MGEGEASGGDGVVWRTRVTSLLGIERPIVQGGLAHLAFAELAAAVSEAGGLGQITAVTTGSPAALRAEIRRLRRRTGRPFAVNLAIGHVPIEPYLDAALEEGAPAITITGGNPEAALRRSEGAGVRRLVLVAGVRAARKAADLGAEAVIAVGHEGGGHIGRDDLGVMALLPRVVEAVDIPVLASGGIVDGMGMLAAFALGAEGVEMGTRLVATAECRAHPRYKAALVAARETDTVVIERSVGRPGRVLDGPYARRILALEAEGADLRALLPLLEGERNRRAALAGDMDEGYVWAGQGVGGIRDIPTVAELFERMEGEFACALARVSSLASGLQGEAFHVAQRGGEEGEEPELKGGGEEER